MSKSLVFLLLITVGFVSVAIANNQEGKKMANDEKSVLNTIEIMTSAFHKGDIEGVMASYEAKATVVFEPKSPVTGSVAIRKMFEGAFALNPKFTYSGHEVFVNGDTAVHIAPWAMKGRTPDGTDIEQSGLSVTVLRRQPDGKWLMVIDNPHGQFLMSQE